MCSCHSHCFNCCHYFVHLCKCQKVSQSFSMAPTVNSFSDKTVWKCLLFWSWWYYTVNWFSGSSLMLGNMAKSARWLFGTLIFYGSSCSATLKGTELWDAPKCIATFLEASLALFSSVPHISRHFAPMREGVVYALISKLFDYYLTVIVVPFDPGLYHNDQHGVCYPAETDAASLICSFALLLYHTTHRALRTECAGDRTAVSKNEIIFSHDRLFRSFHPRAWYSR